MTTTAIKKPVKKQGLGRGLSSLIAQTNSDALAIEPKLFSVENITPNPKQPRRYFDPEAIAELAASIKQNGIIQPIILRSVKGRAGQYEIIAGERRWRAAKKAGIKKVPAIIKELDDKQVMELALIENVQRKDLTALEEAEAYQQLIQDYGHTQAELSKNIGKSRSHIANLIRLTALPEIVKTLLKEGRISAGHARALINSTQAVNHAKAIIQKGLSVRQVEALVRAEQGTNPEKPKRKVFRSLSNNPSPDEDVDALEEIITNNLGMPVKIHPTGNMGKIVLNYGSIGQLDFLLQLLQHDYSNGSKPVISMYTGS